VKLAQDCNLIPEGQYRPLWVIDFPLLEFDEQEGRWVAVHHPFTSPVDEDLPLLEADPDHLKRAILNLVDNAVEAVGGAGDVSVDVAPANGGRVRIVVSDTGPGISPEDKEKLFTPYFSTKVTGMGLGLPIVHEIVHEHGGTIHVEDNSPHGSRFIIEVPVSLATVEA